MASQNHSQRQTSPPSSRQRRTQMACLRCRSRKVKCIPLDDQRTCQRCCDDGFEHECRFISVTDQENLLSRSQDQGPADEGQAVILAGGTPPVQSRGRMPMQLDGDVASSSTVPFAPSPPRGPGNFPAPDIGFNPVYTTSNYPHYPQGYRTYGLDNIPAASFPREAGSHAPGAPWAPQTPSTSTFNTNNATASYAHNVSVYNVDQGMSAAVIMRGQEFQCGYNYEQNDNGQDNQKQWYSDSA